MIRCLKRIPPQLNWKDFAEELARDAGEIFDVECVAAKRYINERWEYLVIWKGYPVEEASWKSR